MVGLEDAVGEVGDVEPTVGEPVGADVGATDPGSGVGCLVCGLYGLPLLEWVS